MDEWWTCEDLELFFEKILRADMTKKITGDWRMRLITLHSILFNRQSRARAGSHDGFKGAAFRSMTPHLIIEFRRQIVLPNAGPQAFQCRIESLGIGDFGSANAVDFLR